MSYRWVEHTAELELEIEAPTEEAVFGEALTALGELLVDEDPPSTRESIDLELSLDGGDRALLLANWLDELVFCAETERVVAQSVERIELGADGLTAVIRGAPASPRPLVKGVTHHRLEFETAERGYRARVVLDV